MERTITVTEAARNFVDVNNLTYYRGESATLVRNGKAVARIVPVPKPPLSGKQLAEMWNDMAHLDPEDAEEFEKEINEFRSKQKMPESKWD